MGEPGAFCHMQNITGREKVVTCGWTKPEVICILYWCVEVPSLRCSMAGSYQVALWCTAVILSIPKVSWITPAASWDVKMAVQCSSWKPA